MMKWIDVGDIKNWPKVKQKHCQGTLPELVRRLILVHTTKEIEEFDFPSGDSVAIGGWDGRLKTPVGSSFFPSGSSGWEIGTEDSAQTKADEDYAKRVANPLGMAPKETTFVFVTPRSFPKRAQWQSGKQAAGDWKDVKVIAADALEQWLEITPAVALWLARQIGKVVSSDFRDLEAVWEEWSIGTKPVMTPALVIGGRTRDVETVQSWIGGVPGILEVQGDHPEEAFAFLYASIAMLPENKKTQALARCVLVENITQLRELTQAFSNYPLIIAGPGECIDAAHAAVAKGHHVFISKDATVIGIRDVLRLARPQRAVVEKVLNESGLSQAKAEQFARDSGRSIPVLRRNLFQSNVVSAPAWAKAEAAKILLPVLFANAWDEHKDGDRQVIEALTGKKHEDFIKELTPFLSVDDSPVRKVGSVWMIKSPLDTWFLLAQHLTQDQLQVFKQSLLAVLTKTDPKYELEAEKRWAAAIYGKSNPYSDWLRTGLVESLVLLAVFGNRSPSIVSTQAFANHVVSQVFATADKWEAWASIQDATPLLAEAAPDTFMEAVEQCITKNPAMFEELMKDGNGGIFGECHHSGLLWALEGIAWSPEYFARAVNILLDLANIDPGGKWGNRAINSVSDLFFPGFPQTHAKSKERLEVLERLIATNPRMVWKFATNYFSRGSISESHRFRWRDTGGVRRGLEQETNEEYREYLKGLLPLLRDLACVRENLATSMDEFIRLPQETREKLLATLEATEPATLSKEERGLLFQKIREALYWINSYGEEDQRVHGPGLNKMIKKFAPADVIERVGWLLADPWPKLPEGGLREHEANDTRVKIAQTEAACEILDKAPIDKILEFSSTIQYQGVLGHSLAIAVKDENEGNTILDGILTHVTDMPVLVRGFASGRVEIVGPGWIDEQIKRLKTQGNYSAEGCAVLYFGLPEGSETWSAVAAHGKDVETAYWKQASGYSRTSKKDDATIAVEKLLDVKRPDAALTIAGSPQADIPSTLLQRLLQEVLNMDEKKIRAGVMEEYYLGHVFNQLYQKNDLPLEEIAKLEWPFAVLLKDLKRYTSSPTALHRTLQKDPQFFSLLVGFIYKRDDHAPDPTRGHITKEMAENRARIAHKVLDSWDLIPGLKDDGPFDEKELTSWVDAARKQCAKTKHVIGCDVQIGFMLAHAPVDPDGTWPHTAVRNLIELLKNETVDRHIQNEIYNSRGVTTRGLSDGGKQERELAERYKKMSDAVKVKWPRTSAMLRGIAESYEYQAKYEDVDSDLRDLRWD
jgi:hypothetical protein